jgi:hypothetical protein
MTDQGKIHSCYNRRRISCSCFSLGVDCRNCRNRTRCNPRGTHGRYEYRPGLLFELLLGAKHLQLVAAGKSTANCSLCCCESCSTPNQGCLRPKAYLSTASRLLLESIRNVQKPRRGTLPEPRKGLVRKLLSSNPYSQAHIYEWAGMGSMGSPRLILAEHGCDFCQL